MQTQLPVPRARQLGGNPVIAAFAALGERGKPHDFMVVVDRERCKRAANKANAVRLSNRYAKVGLLRLFGDDAA